MATVNVYVWPQLALTPGATVTFIHSIVDGAGHSIIDPDRWYWMNAVPDFGFNPPDRPVPESSVAIIAQRAYREAKPRPGPNNTVWIATWTNPASRGTLFRPKLLEAPAP